MAIIRAHFQIRSNLSHNPIQFSDTKFVLPITEDPPTLSFELLRFLPITPNIVITFFDPPLPISFWRFEMFRAAMPKTAVHENAQFCARKNDVRLAPNATNGPHIFPKPESLRVEQTP